MRLITALPVFFTVALLAACGGNSSAPDLIDGATGSNPPVTPVDEDPAPTLSFSAQNTSVIEGESVQLQWSAANVVRCRSTASPVHPDWVDDELQDFTSDGFSITNLQSDTTFTFACRGADGSLISQSLGITVTPVSAPSISFSAQDNSIIKGGNTQLRWNARNVIRCRSEASPAHPSWVDDELQEFTSDGFDITNLQRDTAFTLTCRADDNVALISETVNIDVIEAPTVSFSSSISRVVQGESTQLAWSTTDTARCRSTASPSHPDWVDDELQALNSTGVNVTNLQTDTRFTFTCRGLDGTLVSDTVDISVTSSGEDGDGDGVLGLADACPTTPIGESIDASGCANSEYIPVEQININAGGENYVAADGTFFQADKYFSGGNPLTSSFSSYQDTEDDVLFRTIRDRASSYSIPVTNGLYSIEFLATETVWEFRNVRVFDIAVEGDTVVSSFDIYTEAGDRRATAVSRLVDSINVTDGELNINFTARRDLVRIVGFKITRFDNPARDDDGDGIANTSDRCFATPTGISVDFEGCPNQALAVNGFMLIDADQDRAITELADGQTLDLASLPAGLTLEVIPESGDVGHIDFIYDGLIQRGSDSERPFTLQGDERAADGSIDYLPWSLGVPRPLDAGVYEITARASLFTGGELNPANGSSVGESAIRFTLINSRPREPVQAVAHGINDFRTFSNGLVPSYSWTLEDPNDNIILYSEVDASVEDATRWMNWYSDCNSIYELVLDRPARVTNDSNFGRGKVFGSLRLNGCGSATGNSAGCGNKVQAQGFNTITNANRTPERLLTHWVLMYEMGRGGSSEPFGGRGIWPTDRWNTAMPHTMAMACFHAIGGDEALEDRSATPGRILFSELNFWETLDLEFAEFFVAGSRTPDGSSQKLYPQDLVAGMLGRILQETDLFTIRDIWRRLRLVPVRDNAVAAMCDFVNAVNAETEGQFNSRMRGEWGLPEESQCSA